MHTANAFSIIEWSQETGGHWANLAIVVSAIIGIALYRQARHQRLLKETLKHIILPERNEGLREARRILHDNRVTISKTSFYELPTKIRDAIVLTANHYDFCGFVGRKKLMLLEDYLEVTMFVVIARWNQISPLIEVMRERFRNPLLLKDFEWLASEATKKLPEKEEGQ